MSIFIISTLRFLKFVALMCTIIFGFVVAGFLQDQAKFGWEMNLEFYNLFNNTNNTWSTNNPWEISFYSISIVILFILSFFATTQLLKKYHWDTHWTPVAASLVFTFILIGVYMSTLLISSFPMLYGDDVDSHCFKKRYASHCG